MTRTTPLHAHTYHITHTHTPHYAHITVIPNNLHAQDFNTQVKNEVKNFTSSFGHHSCTPF